MAQTSTSFKKGHRGIGGRPKGTKTGAGRNAFRTAGKRAADIARKIDALQSGLLNDPALSTDQRVRLFELVRNRRKHYEHRSEYLRPITRTGGFQIVYRHGVTYDRSAKRWTRNEGTEITTRARRAPSRLDNGARAALRKLPKLDRVIEGLLEGLSKADSTVVNPSSHANSQLRALASLIKVEAEWLSRSRDPRPLLIHRPFRIVLSRIPYDLMSRDFNPDQPLRGLGRPSERWTKDEIRADLKERMRVYQDRGLEPPAWLQQVAEWSKNDGTHRRGTGRVPTAPPTTSSKADRFNPSKDNDASGRASTSLGTASTMASSSKTPRATTTSEEPQAKQFLEEFHLEEDRPSECVRCRGRGYFCEPRVCGDCDGTRHTYNDDGTRSRCTRCKGKGRVLVRLRDCPDCDGTGYSYVPDDYRA